MKKKLQIKDSLVQQAFKIHLNNFICDLSAQTSSTCYNNLILLLTQQKLGKNQITLTFNELSS